MKYLFNKKNAAHFAGICICFILSCLESFSQTKTNGQPVDLSGSWQGTTYYPKNNVYGEFYLQRISEQSYSGVFYLNIKSKQDNTPMQTPGVYSIRFLVFGQFDGRVFKFDEVDTVMTARGTKFNLNHDIPFYFSIAKDTFKLSGVRDEQGNVPTLNRVSTNIPSLYDHWLVGPSSCKLDSIFFGENAKTANGFDSENPREEIGYIGFSIKNRAHINFPEVRFALQIADPVTRMPKTSEGEYKQTTTSGLWQGDAKKLLIPVVPGYPTGEDSVHFIVTATYVDILLAQQYITVSRKLLLANIGPGFTARMLAGTWKPAPSSPGTELPSIFRNDLLDMFDNGLTISRNSRANSIRNVRLSRWLLRKDTMIVTASDGGKSSFLYHLDKDKLILRPITGHESRSLVFSKISGVPFKDCVTVMPPENVLGSWAIPMGLSSKTGWFDHEEQNPYMYDIHPSQNGWIEIIECYRSNYEKLDSIGFLKMNRVTNVRGDGTPETYSIRELVGPGHELAEFYCIDGVIVMIRHGESETKVWCLVKTGPPHWEDADVLHDTYRSLRAYGYFPRFGVHWENCRTCGGSGHVSKSVTVFNDAVTRSTTKTETSLCADCNGSGGSYVND